MVAKSYQNLTQLGEPYKENGKMYVNVATKSNPCKKVRWYDEKEYNKLYPKEVVKAVSVKSVEATVSAPTYKRENAHILKHTLGFGEAPNDFIYIIKGYDDELHKDYFFSRNTRRNGWVNWYYPWNETIPDDLPFGLELIKLRWNEVGNPDGTMKPIAEVHKSVDKYLYDKSKSEYFGAVGTRYDLKLKVTRAIAQEATEYGQNIFHTMEDENENVFLWTTSSKRLEEGKWYTMRGTVKDYSTYHGTQQTILTRCMSIKEIE